MSGYLDMELLRFTTAGSVDDGKSTLIGRLLYDSKSIFQDQMEAVEQASKRSGTSEINLALLTDGLRAEREQGITIDVAYRYFATPRRKFIIADTPGHIQYTRNMVTGASTADLAIILIDARNGIVEQTIRHSYIASLLRIPHIAVCVNKMDLVDYSQAKFDDIVAKYREIATKLDLEDVNFIAISAKFGDNVVERSVNMPWYEGRTLIDVLEQTPIVHKLGSTSARLPVQYVIRPMRDEFHDFRGYAGRMSSGVLKKGDVVHVLPSGVETTVKEVFMADKEVVEAITPLSVTVTLADDIDASRGDMIVAAEGVQPTVSQDITVMLCWLNEKPLTLGAKYIIRHTTAETIGVVKSIDYKVDMETLQHLTDDKSIQMNDIARLTLRTARPLVFDAYKDNRTTGSLVFIDSGTNETIGAAMIVQK
ncbi:MAG: GTP-binding protein [Mucinivorans sp.]